MDTAADALERYVDFCLAAGEDLLEVQPTGRFIGLPVEAAIWIPNRLALATLGCAAPSFPSMRCPLRRHWISGPVTGAC